MNSTMREQIINETNWLPPHTPIKIRRLSIANRYTPNTFPRCHCGQLVTYDKVYQTTLSKYCSSTCSRKAQKRLSAETYNCLSNKDWLFEQRITLRKSFEEIGSDLNCSITPVKRACKQHNIPSVRWNESDSLTKSFLRNKDWLIQKHKVEKLKIVDIATEINSSPATVSRWLQYHNIST